jgi:hypothetical protein
MSVTDSDSLAELLKHGPKVDQVSDLHVGTATGDHDVARVEVRVHTAVIVHPLDAHLGHLRRNDVEERVQLVLRLGRLPFAAALENGLADTTEHDKACLSLAACCAGTGLEALACLQVAHFIVERARSPLLRLEHLDYEWGRWGRAVPVLCCAHRQQRVRAMRRVTHQCRRRSPGRSCQESSWCRTCLGYRHHRRTLCIS